MKQSEKYEALQYVFWDLFDHERRGEINMLFDGKLYRIGPFEATGAKIKSIWNKLLWFRDEARNREETEDKTTPPEYRNEPAGDGIDHRAQ